MADLDPARVDTASRLYADIGSRDYAAILAALRDRLEKVDE